MAQRPEVSDLNVCLSLGASGRNGYLEVMMKMADKYKQKSWGLVSSFYFMSSDSLSWWFIDGLFVFHRSLNFHIYFCFSSFIGGSPPP